MRFSPFVDRIAGEETGAWRVHNEGIRRREAGHDVIFLTVGDPDQAAPEAVIGATIEALRRNRTGYSPIIGYPQVRAAVEKATKFGDVGRALPALYVLRASRIAAFEGLASAEEGAQLAQEEVQGCAEDERVALLLVSREA